MEKNLKFYILFTKSTKNYLKYILFSTIISKRFIAIVIILVEIFDAIFILKILKIFPKYLLVINFSLSN